MVIKLGTKVPKSIGIVARIAWDSESESDEEEDEKLEGEQVEVCTLGHWSSCPVSEPANSRWSG